MPATLPGTWRCDSGLLQEKDFQSIHPSLQRQAGLNMAYCRYPVLLHNIYQAGWLRPGQHLVHQGRYRLYLFYRPTAKETARAALDLHQ